MYKKLLLLLIVATTTCSLNAQVKTNFNNTDKISVKGKFNTNYSTMVFELPVPDLKSAFAREKSETSDGSKVFYIAEPVKVNIDAGKLASWVEDGRYFHGKFTLISKGAKTLSVNFSNFFLPIGTEMYIYNKDAEMITGVITDAENNKDKLWGSSIYKGDELNIEFKVPISEKEKLNLQITNVAYGYKDIFVSKVAGFGLSGACNINVLCPQGNNWVAERNSVVYIARSNGDALCSGSMLMNTCATNIPYILTANHCFVGDGNVSQWRVHFQAWSATCTPNQNSDGILFNGSTLRANWAPSDFCLVQLNSIPPANSGIHYAGWSRATNAATSGVSIHHPSGDVMKISTFTTPLLRADNSILCGINPIGDLQWIVNWNSGITEGGSSGSPLFDQNHRVVGQLGGGPSSCTATAACRQDAYGRFDNSWTGGGTNATRLSNWLDPSNSGAITTNTTNVSNLITLASLSISGSPSFCNGTQQYTLSGVPAGTNISWESSNTNVATISPTGNPVTLTKASNGYVTITARITGTGCENAIGAITKTIVIGSPVTISSTRNGCNGVYQIWNMSAGPTGNGSNWNWSVSYLGTNSQITIYSPSTASTTMSVKGGGTVNLNYTDACGVAHIDGVTVYSTCFSPPFFVTVSPNPANENIKLSFNQQTDTSSDFKPNGQDLKPVRSFESNGKTIITLYDFNTGVLVKRWMYKEIKSKNYNFNVTNLKKGLYVLQVDRDNQTRTTKIIIE